MTIRPRGRQEHDVTADSMEPAAGGRFLSGRRLLPGLLFIAGVVAITRGASLAWDRVIFPETLPTGVSVDNLNGTGFEVSTSPSLASLAWASALLTAGVVMVGVTCLLALKRFSLRLLLAVVLIASASGSALHVLVPGNDVELVALMSFDAKPSCLREGRMRLEASSVLSAYPAPLWRRVGIDAADIRIEAWSVLGFNSGCRAELVLRLGKQYEPEQLLILCRAYAQRIAQMALESAPEESRTYFLSCFKEASDSEYVFKCSPDREIKAWLEELDCIDTARESMELIKRGERPVPATGLERYEVYIQEHQAKADEILKRM